MAVAGASSRRVTDSSSATGESFDPVIVTDTVASSVPPLSSETR